MRLLTPPGRGGIAVVAAFGQTERAALLACLRTRAGGAVAAAAGAPPRLCVVAPQGVAIDEGLLVDRGEAGLELHLHGSPAIVAALAAVGPWVREAVDPATMLLRQALSPGQLELALEQQRHDFVAHLAALAALPGAARTSALAATRARTRIALAHALPLRLVLVGRQNAGKSTLMNRLLFQERVLTGPLPGLTRDPVREITVLDGYPYQLVDTAGEGGATTRLDQCAIDLARRERTGADRLLVVDASAGPTTVDRALVDDRTFVLASKCDLPVAPWPDDLRCDLRVSCASAEDAPALRIRVGQALRHWRQLPPAGPVGGPAALDAVAAQRLADLGP
ncbi:MAG: 50S ribosome-binding GTPase [Planctomycetes bacterium]|nr:50S ribosome-binding GTPase [Planctomycetota bacterium]